MKKVSVITTLYQGNKYLKTYVEKMKKVLDYSFANQIDVDFVFVNDSPEIAVDESELKKLKPYFQIIQNQENVGIHQSRVNGLKYIKGDYVLFLDQDDYVLPEFVVEALKKIEQEQADVCLCNGYFEKEESRELIYANEKVMKYILNYNRFSFYRNFIVSPGQCLIRVSDILKKWSMYTLKCNGADDYYLWLLMLENHCKFTTHSTPLYVHTYQKTNLSFDLEKMKRSVDEMVSLLLKENPNNRHIKRLSKNIHIKEKFKNSSKVGKIILIFQHFLFFSKIIWYKLKIKMVV